MHGITEKVTFPNPLDMDKKDVHFLILEVK